MSLPALVSSLAAGTNVPTTRLLGVCMPTAPPAPTGLATSATRDHPWRTALPALYGLLLLSLVARAIFTAWEPPSDGVLRYDEIRAVGEAYWPMNLYVGGPGYLVTFVAAAVFLVLLGRGRTVVLNLVAAGLVGLGGTVFALVITAEALPFAYAADPTVLSEAEGRALFDVLNAHFDWLTPAIVGGMAVVAAGVLLALATGWFTRALPRWFAVSGVVYVVVLFAVPPGVLPRPVELTLYVVELGMWAGLGWFGLRSARRSMIT